MTTFAVTVTYGNRFHLLKQVIDRALSEGVAKVIVVDNNSVEESRNRLREYEKELNGKIKVLYLDDNYGSAGGFKRGLQEAYSDSECEFIWLLDDDNQPQKNSLKALEDFWETLKDDNKEEKVSLLSYRKDRTAYKEAIMTNNPDLVLGRKNSFLGFHIIDLPKKVLKVLKRKIGLKTFKETKNITNGKVSVAPYGGMFFHKNLISSIGYPNEDFYLYADDHEWSYRITKSGGNIYLVLDSLVDDIDTSWNLKETTSSPFYSFLNAGSDLQVYYTVRNRVYFEKCLITNIVSYLIQKKIFIFLLSFYKNSSNVKRYHVFKKAVRDGINSKLGKEYEKNSTF